MYRLSPKKEGYVADFADKGDVQRGWNMELRRQLMKSEIPELSELLGCWDSVKLNEERTHYFGAQRKGRLFLSKQATKCC